jgi:hypothetical protein
LIEGGISFFPQEKAEDATLAALPNHSALSTLVMRLDRTGESPIYKKVTW